MSDFYTVSGTVENLANREVTTKYGPKTVYGVVVSGTPVEYKLGTKPEQVPGVGAIVALRVEKKFGRYEVQGPAVGDPTAPPLAPKGPRGVSGGTPRPDRPFPIPTSHGDTSIVRQNSLGHAVAIVSRLSVELDGDGMLPTQLANELAELAIKIAYKFAAFSSGNLDVEVLKEIADGKTKAST